MLVLGMAQSVLAPSAESLGTDDGSRAGYEVTTAAGFTHATGTYRVPTVECGGQDMQRTLYVRWTASLDEADAGVVVDVTCRGGVATLAGIVTADDRDGFHRAPLDVHSGDVLSAHFRYATDSGKISVVGRNLTTGQEADAATWQAALLWTQASFAFDRAFDPSPAIPTMSDVPFSQLTLDGEPVATREQTIVEARTLTADGHVLMRPSAFNPVGGGFRDVFVRTS